MLEAYRTAGYERMSRERFTRVSEWYVERGEADVRFGEWCVGI